ncbi:MAG TPA: preprotein translocase subunit SecE [Candidatus Paceibacterota bacterium]|nr:preprotein translocase subunit SecE [Candidatus Paceibacterota bacterium]
MAEVVKQPENGPVSKPKQWWLSTKEFFRETQSEMKKVTWPTKNEVVGTTGVVIAATIVFALFLWGCDLVFYKAIDFLFTRFGAGT